MQTKVSSEAKSDTVNFRRALEVFREMDAEMPIGQILFFLRAAEMYEPTLKDIADASDVKMTTASRYLANLSAKDRFRQEGLNLLFAYENPANRRQKIITLTPEGVKVLEAVSAMNNPKKGASK